MSAVESVVSPLLKYLQELSLAYPGDHVFVEGLHGQNRWPVGIALDNVARNILAPLLLYVGAVVEVELALNYRPHAGVYRS